MINAGKEAVKIKEGNTQIIIWKYQREKEGI